MLLIKGVYNCPLFPCFSLALEVHICPPLTWSEPEEFHFLGFEFEFLHNPWHNRARATTIHQGRTQIINLEQTLTGASILRVVSHFYTESYEKNAIAMRGSCTSKNELNYSFFSFKSHSQIFQTDIKPRCNLTYAKAIIILTVPV